MSSLKQQRLTLRQSSAQAQRRTMNERRQLLTQRLRKQKKSDMLAQKRGYHEGCTKTATSVGLSQSIALFRQNTPTLESLQELEVALRSASLPAKSWSLEENSRLEQAQQLVQRLGETLQYFVTTNNPKGTLGTVQVLMQLVSLDSKEKNSDYYGRRPPTWSELLMEEARIPSCLPTLITLPKEAAASDERFQVMEQTLWLIGNWTLGFPSCAVHLRRSLVNLLVALLSLIHQDEMSTSLQFLRIIQASAWAFVNLLKGDSTASGWDYCCQAGWNPALASRLLTLSVPVIQPSLQLERSCIDIQVQSAWTLVHISKREDDVIDAILHDTDLVRDVLERLHQVCEGAQQQQACGGSLSPGRPNYFHHPLLEPCLEVLGHWATGCNGKYVPCLLAPTLVRGREELSLLSIMEKMMHWGQDGLLQVSDYVQLLWLSGCLLCDAGTPNHPSTSQAAPSLIPLLTRSLQETPNAVTSRANSLECKREGVLALWNALNAPPSEGEKQQLGAALLLTGDNENTNKIGYNTIMALKSLLLCPDVDAMLASLQVLNVILRQIPSTRVIFMEVGGDEALETVCDLPCGSDRASNEAADMAAQLVDDFFNSEVGDDQFADPVLQPATAGGVFVFGLPNAAPIFLPDVQTDSDFLAPVVSVGGDPVVVPGPGSAHGRGRGHVLPAWATQQAQR